MSGFEVMTVSQVGVEPAPHMNNQMFTHAAALPASREPDPVVMPRNLHHIERRWNPATQRHEDVPIPFACGCGRLSCYGRGGVWYCSPCWQARAA